MQKDSEKRFAVLIDADNISFKNIKAIMSEIAKYGIPTYKRIYGDWTKPNLSGWKTILLDNAIIPIQQYSYTSGKNSTDSAMIIDAMDILYSGNIEGFCLVSSDSDFTRLALRIREQGLYVIGIGEKKTPNPFISACEKFIYTEIFESEDKEQKSVKVAKSNEKSIPIIKTDIEPITNLIEMTINDIADEDGWAFLGDIGNLLAKKQPDFDPRNYGYAKLSRFILSLKRFEIENRKSPNEITKLLYVRCKNS